MTVAGRDAPQRRNYWLFLVPAAFLGLAGLLYWGFSRDAATVPSVLIGKPAPRAELPALDGLLRDGKPVPGITGATLAGDGVSVVNVFASWCVPCREEHATLTRFAREGKARLIGINYKDKPQNALGFIGELGNPYAAVGVDANGRSSIEWGVYGVPETFVVDASGMITEKFIGPILSEQQYQALLEAVGRAAR